MSSIIYDIRIGSANLQIALITLLFLGCLFLQLQKVINILGEKVILILALAAFFIIIKKLVGQLGSMQSMRLIYILPLFWVIYRVYTNDYNIKDKVVSIIIWNCFLVAIFGIVHFFFFPSVLFNHPANESFTGIWNISGHIQEAAFFGNSSTYGCVLLTGLFGIYLSKKKGLLYSIIFVVILLGVLLSVSRWAILFSVILFIMFLKDNFKLRRNRLIQLLFVLMMIIFILYKFPYFTLTAQYAYGKWGFSRIMSGESVTSWATGLASGRFPGYELAMQILFSDISHFMLGGLLEDSFISGDIAFSDNSFIFIAIKFGIPLAILWIIVILFKVVPLRFKNKKHLFILLFFYGTIFHTPALYWDLWVLYILGILNFVDSEHSFTIQHAKDVKLRN